MSSPGKGGNEPVTGVEPPYGKARYPAFRTIAARLDTFTNWPKSQEIHPEDLASAGFFYKAEGDRVQCFVCGCIFHNLDRFFSPKEDHRELVPSCNFARLYAENPKLLVEMSAMPAVRAVVDLGYSMSQIEMAYRRVTRTGNQSPSAGDLLDVVWEAPETLNLTNGSSHETTLEEQQEQEEEDLYSARLSHSFPHACANYEEIDDEGDEEPVTEIDMKKMREDQAECTRLRGQVELLEQDRRCRSCTDQKANTVNLPCGHIATCVDCVYKNNRCRICNTLIRGIVKVYMV